MASSVNEAQLSYHLYLEYASAREDWARNAAEDEDFYLGKQWTDDEIKRITEKGMAPLSVNRVMPVIQHEVSIFLANRPSARYYPMEDGDVATAALFNTLYDYIWQNSNGDQQSISAALDYFALGACYFQVFIDRYADDGNGEVLWKNIPVWDVYPDPNSREPDLSDAKYVIVSRLIDRSALKFMYPDKASAIDKAPGEDGPAADRPSMNPDYEGASISISDIQFTESIGNEQKVRIIERHELVRRKLAKIIDSVNGSIMVVEPNMVDKDRLPPGTRLQWIWRTHERVTVSLDKDVMLYQYENDVPYYTIVPAFLHHRRNPYPKGDVSVMKGLQQETNKRRSIMIHNATLSGNYRIMAEKNSIQNKAEWEREGSKPGFILEYVVGSSGQPPREMLPQALPTAWIQLEQEAKADMEYSVSVFAHQMGSNFNAPETYRGLLALEENGQKRIQHKARALNLAYRNMGRIIMRMAQRVYRSPKVLRVVGNSSQEINETLINHFALNENGEKIEKFNDISIGKYDLVVLDGTSMPTNRMAMLSIYMDLYQLGVVDKYEVIKKTDIIDRDELLQRVGEVSNMQAQLSQMEEAIKSTDGLNQTLRRQLQQAMVQIEALKGSEEIKEEVATTRSHQALMRERTTHALALLKEKQAMRERQADQNLKIFLEKQKLEVEKTKLDLRAKAKEAKSE